MKKIITILLILTMVTMVFAGCSKEEDANDDMTKTDSTETTEDTSSDSDDVDTVTTASIVDNSDALIAAMSADGTWIAATLNDIVIDTDIVVEGEFTNKDKVDRKLALYTQDEDHNITEQFTLTAPKLIVKSENFRIVGGTFVGDVYVEAPGFKLDKSSTVDGNIYFDSQELLDTFTTSDTSVITGTVSVDGVDVVTTASLVTDAKALAAGLSADGTWIVAAYNNMISKEDIVVEGEFIHREEVARKLGLYAQDEDRNVTARYTLTLPQLIVRSENFKIQGGIIVGDVIVEANGFEIKDATVEGNVYFSSQEYMDSMVDNDDATVTGVIEVQ